MQESEGQDQKEWKEEESDQGYEVRNDEGYEGDMEGDGGLMPPPTTVP